MTIKCSGQVLSGVVGGAGSCGALGGACALGVGAASSVSGSGVGGAVCLNKIKRMLDHTYKMVKHRKLSKVGSYMRRLEY